MFKEIINSSKNPVMKSRNPVVLIPDSLVIKKKREEGKEDGLNRKT